MSKSYWWCDVCKNEVDGKCVTFSEMHEICGNPVREITTAKHYELTGTSAEHIASLEAQLAELHAQENVDKGVIAVLTLDRIELHRVELADRERTIETLKGDLSSITSCGYVTTLNLRLENDRLREQVGRLKGLLVQYQWSAGNFNECPACHESMYDDHTANCIIAAELKESK